MNPSRLTPQKTEEILGILQCLEGLAKLGDKPGDGEQAGGSVLFSSYLDPAGRRHLVASRGLFYRSSTSTPLDGASTRFVRLLSANQRWHLLPVRDHPCTGGLTTFRGPSRTAEGREFRGCVARHWERQEMDPERELE